MMITNSSRSIMRQCLSSSHQLLRQQMIIRPFSCTPIPSQWNNNHKTTGDDDDDMYLTEEQKAQKKKIEAEFREIQERYADVRKFIQDQLSENGGVVSLGPVDLPSPGVSSGDPDLDESVRAWRLTNTEDDPRFAKVFKKKTGPPKGSAAANVLNMANGLMDGEDDDDDGSTEVHLSEEESKEYINPYNDETGEYNGPKGPEPTRYGDWERSGRVSDF